MARESANPTSGSTRNAVRRRCFGYLASAWSRMSAGTSDASAASVAIEIRFGNAVQRLTCGRIEPATRNASDLGSCFRHASSRLL
jgi:hypothetical protein